MKRFKGFFLFLVIMLLSLGIASTTYARERDGSSRERDWENYGSRGYRGRSDYDSGWGGPKLNYDGRTSGIGRELGGHIVGSAAGAIGGAIGGSAGGVAGGPAGGAAGGIAGAYYGGRFGDAWERRANSGAFDKWNRNGRRGRSWRL